MKELIRLQQPNGSKRLWESEDLQNTNLSVCESKKLRNLWVNICKKLGLPMMLQNQIFI